MADLIHFGHINALKKAKDGADLHIFGLVSDKACDDWYGVHVSDEKERLAVLKSVKYIDEVVVQKDFDPLDNLKAIHERYPNATITLFYGSEWSVLSSKSYLESIGGFTKKIDYYDKLSPQRILDALNATTDTNKKNNTSIVSTKANTLLALKSILKKSVIEDIFVVNIKDFKTSEDVLINKIQHFFNGDSIVVRSSSKREDAFDSSNAGHFTSVIGVDSNNHIEVKKAIEEVMVSYGDYYLDDEQILVQRQTKNVLMSGVVFTRDIQHNRPYYVINYDVSGSTDSVTSGICGKAVWISNDIERSNVSRKWKKLMDSVWELQDALPGILLDIEFAITNDSIVIFQVRPLAAAYKFGRNNNDSAIKNAKNYSFQKYLKYSSEGLNVFSDMSFWNPAEIIGDNPKNLDYSLYRTIITRTAWNDGLVPMGYRKVTPELMYRFGNKPFISLEKSFEALMPASISNELAAKLKVYYLEELKKNPSAHDKIEFEISHNCFDFVLRDRLNKLFENGFSKDEVSQLETGLIDITKKCISSYKSVLEQDLADLNELEKVRVDIEKNVNTNNDYRSLAVSIRLLIDAIERLGTPQFSRHARCAFISKSLCKSLVEKGYISSEIYNTFLSTVKTIAVEYDCDYHNVISGSMSQSSFLNKYGHLRSGTYNINSPRYDQTKDLFSVNESESKHNNRIGDDSSMIDATIKNALKDALVDYNLKDLSADDVIFFIKESTKQREFFKFIFTKSLSYAIELIKKMGDYASIETKKLAYLELPEIYSAEHYSSVNRLKEFWELVINRRQEIYHTNSNLILPSFIKDKMDFDVIEVMDSRANFITDKIATGEVCFLGEETKDVNIFNKIIVIEKADPGFDWIFSKGITGLITKYGGAASHMAIRCAEFKVAAAIGCGSTLFEYACNSHTLTIDCKHEKLIRKD